MKRYLVAGCVAVVACGPGARGPSTGTEIVPDSSCPAVHFEPKPLTPSIGLVLDNSNSMNLADIAPTRFTAMRDALVGVSGVVAALESKAYFGSSLYTCYNSLSLDLKNVPRALNNAAAIRASIDSGGPGGNTPTAAALTRMVAEFNTNPPPAGSPPIIVLATDGEPNDCSSGFDQNQYNAQAVAAAQASYAAGIPVYVLAIAQNSQHFQDMANAGQGATTNVPYYPVSNAASLQGAFQAIINGVISCDLVLDKRIDEGSAMAGKVVVNGVELVFGVDWVLVGGNTIRLLGAACDVYKAASQPMATAEFPCGSVLL